MKQKYMFLESEGDRWFERNRDGMVKVSEADPVTVAINQLKLKPKRVLEVGCSNGWRLALLRELFGCEIMGVEPSMQAALDAAARRVPVVQATASSLAVSNQFDLVIYGFCLYLTEPADWLLVASEGDRVLAAGGHLIIHDFSPVGHPFARRYEHRDGILSYHFDFAGLWLGSPLYHVIARHMIGDDEMVTVLKKSDIATIPVRP